MSALAHRPWYVIDELCDDYLTVAENGGDLRMLQLLKVIRGLTLNFLVVVVAFLALSEGADATLIGTTALISLALVNGVEAVDFLAAKQALAEATDTTSDGDDDR